jgi:hypothetical protein
MGEHRLLRDRLPGWFRRLLTRLRHRRFDRELREELAAHEAMVREALEASGVTTDEARSRARKQLGSVTRAREDARAVWVPVLADSMRADFRYAARGLARYPVYTLTAVLTLVVAIGLNSSLFTVFNGIYLRPWPVEDARSLFVVTLGPRAGEPDKGMPGIEGMAYGDFVAVRDRATRSALAAFGDRIGSISVRAGSTAGTASVLPVSRDFFAVVRPRLLMGRGLTAADAESQAAVISHGFWTTRFSGDPAILGRSLFVEGVPATIVGVLEPAFAGIPPRSVDVYVALPASTPWIRRRRAGAASGVRKCRQSAARPRAGPPAGNRDRDRGRFDDTTLSLRTRSDRSAELRDCPWSSRHGRAPRDGDSSAACGYRGSGTYAPE